MNVVVVSITDEYGTDSVLGVYSTDELAINAYLNFEKNYEHDIQSVSYEHFTIDEINI